MKVRELMTSPVLSIGAGESVEVAARTLTQYNIGALPVCGTDGSLCGVVTDRDLVTRCMAAQKPMQTTRVRDVMTSDVACASPDMDASVAAHLMGRQQVRRLPVVENGQLCGMLALADLARWENSFQDAADALGDISENLR
jgi:CBS domain-containing protein